MPDPADRLPRIFVALSSGQLAVAEQIAQVLREQAPLDVQVWHQVFAFSAAHIEALEAELDRADFAVVVLTGDDAANVRLQSTVLSRDNVLFELGLFIGRLGRPRCFFFVDAASDTQVASDPSGVKAAAYHPEQQQPPDPRQPTVRQQAAQGARQIMAFGERALRQKSTARERAEQEALWRLCSRLAGRWWERMQASDDDASALSLLLISVEPVTLAPTWRGAPSVWTCARWRSGIRPGPAWWLASGRNCITGGKENTTTPSARPMAATV